MSARFSVLGPVSPRRRAAARRRWHVGISVVLSVATLMGVVVAPVGSATRAGAQVVDHAVVAHNTDPIAPPNNPGCNDPSGGCVIEPNGCPQGGPIQAPTGQHCVPIPGELVIKQQEGAGGSCLTNDYAQVEVLPFLDDYESVWWSDIGEGTRWWEAPGTTYPDSAVGEGYAYPVPKGYAAWSAAGGANGSGGCPNGAVAGTYGVSGWGESDRWMVSGFVTYAVNDKPVEGVKVTADCPSGYSVNTDKYGFYEFLLRPGTCKIVPTPIDGLEVDPTDRTVDVHSNLRHVDFQLSATLYFKVSKGLEVKAPSGLVKAGTAFTERVELKDISKTKDVLVAPLYPVLRGNASGGALQPAGGVIQKNTASPATGNPSPVVVLHPGQEQLFDSVIYTDASKALGTNDGDKRVSGGTRATVQFKVPIAFTLGANDSLTLLPRAQIVVEDNSLDPINVSLDDSAPDQLPFNGLLAAVDIAQGTWHGLLHFTEGLIQGVCFTIKSLGTAIINIPSGVKAYITAEAELWQQVKDNPVERALFFNLVTNTTLLAYKQAPFLIKKIGNVWNAVNSQVFQHFNAIEQDWATGDWEAAVQAWSDDSANLAANLLMLHPQYLIAAISDAEIARVPALINDAEKAEAAEFAAEQPVVDAAIGSGETEGEIGNAIQAEAKLKPGMGLTWEGISQVFGVDKASLNAMIALAERDNVIITLRSRAQEAIALIEKGIAYVKPAAIKLKTVNAIDVKYLGYPGDFTYGTEKISSIGTVMVREPIGLSATCARDCALAQFQANLVADGLAADSPEYIEVSERWAQRYDEWVNPDPGYVANLDATGQKKVMELDWHWAENHIYPDQLSKTAQKVGFRMFKTPEGVVMPQVRLPGQPWKVITGDIDLVSITNADNGALSDAQYIKVLEDAGASEAMIQHPATATWYGGMNDETSIFDPINESFANKTKYMQADKCCLMQIGPDGKVRAVELKLGGSEFVNKNKYFLKYEGGYEAPAPGVLGPDGGTSIAQAVRQLLVVSSVAVTAMPQTSAITSTTLIGDVRRAVVRARRRA